MRDRAGNPTVVVLWQTRPVAWVMRGEGGCSMLRCMERGHGQGEPMKKIGITLVAVALAPVATVQPVRAEMDGHVLLQNLKNDEFFTEMTSYLIGALSAFVAVGEICSPTEEGIGVVDAYNVMRDYLDSHSRQLDRPAIELVWKAGRQE